MAECSDLDSLQCVQYPEYCNWDQNLGQCQEVAFDTLDFNYDCIPYNDINPIPTNTTEYAEMCIDYVGVPPSVDCGDGVPIPVYVDGISMNVDQLLDPIEDANGLSIDGFPRMDALLSLGALIELRTDTLYIETIS